MYAHPVHDTLVLAIDDEQNEDWVFHYIEFDPTAHVRFATPKGGSVVTATVNPESFAAWIIASGMLYASSREMQVAVRLPLPVKGLVPFDVSFIDQRYYVCGDASNIWYYDVPAEKWVGLMVPEPKPVLPARNAGESAEAHAARTSPEQYEYARQYPDIYRAFAVGQDHYFVGALGRVIRLRAEELSGQWVDSGVRLIHGYEEGGQAVLCGSGPVAQIYKGTLDGGFELIFENDNPALCQTACFNGTRYIGAALNPDHDGDCLYQIEDGDLVPVKTGCDREPDHLRYLMKTGSVLWAVDLNGIFRLTAKGWTLTELSDLA